MGQVQITFTRTCEYVATVDTSELRELLTRIPGSDDCAAPLGLDELEGRAGSYSDRCVRELAYVIGNTESGRRYLEALSDRDDTAGYGTSVPEVTDLRSV